MTEIMKTKANTTFEMREWKERITKKTGLQTTPSPGEGNLPVLLNSLQLRENILNESSGEFQLMVSTSPLKQLLLLSFETNEFLPRDELVVDFWVEGRLKLRKMIVTLAVLQGSLCDTSVPLSLGPGDLSNDCCHQSQCLSSGVPAPTDRYLISSHNMPVASDIGFIHITPSCGKWKVYSIYS